MRKQLFSVYYLAITIAAFPLALFFILFGLLGDRVGAYTDVSIIVGRIPFLLGERVRNLYYKATLQSVGKKVIFRYGTYCQYRTAEIGNNVLFGYFNTIGEIKMGDDVVIGGYVNFISGTSQHAFDDPKKKITEQKAGGRKKIIISSDVWIGSNSVIASDIGTHCVIGAASLLVKEAESFSVYGGNPAKLLRKIS